MTKPNERLLTDSEVLMASIKCGKDKNAHYSTLNAEHAWELEELRNYANAKQLISEALVSTLKSELAKLKNENAMNLAALDADALTISTLNSALAEALKWQEAALNNADGWAGCLQELAEVKRKVAEEIIGEGEELYRKNGCGGIYHAEEGVALSEFIEQLKAKYLPTSAEAGEK